MVVVSERKPLAVDPEIFRPDPHAGFAKVRPKAGLIDVGGAMRIVTRHADVATLSANGRTRQTETDCLTVRGIDEGALFNFYRLSMILSNAPEHLRRRRPVAKAFAFKLVEAWRGRIREIVSAAVDGVVARGEMEFVDAVAAPLPSRLIAEIVGAPPEDAPQFARLVYVMTRGLGAFKDSDFAGIDAAAAKLADYVEDLMAERQRRPRDDFLTEYLAKVEEAGELTREEALMQILSLLVAGSDTTRLGLTLTLSLLLTHRREWEALCEDPSLARGAVLEGLRYEPPVGSSGRVVTEAIEVDGITVPPGTMLSLSILSAQRDERVYAAPDRFDIRRGDHPRWSVSFGGGAHRCLGEALARAEMEEALLVLAARLPGLRIVGEPARAKGHSGVRGLSPLHLGWDTPAG